MGDDNDSEKKYEIEPKGGNPNAEKWAEASKDGFPRFAGEDFGAGVTEAVDSKDANMSSVSGETEAVDSEDANMSSVSGETNTNNEYASATRLNNMFRLDAISEYYGDEGIEKVMNGILTFDAKDATASDVVTKFYMHMDIDSPEERKKIRELDAGMDETASGAEKNNEKTKITSMEGLIQDLQAMKELIKEIKAADPAAAEDLESGSSGGYFRRIERSAMKRYRFGGVTGIIKYLSDKKEAIAAGRVEEFEAEDKAEIEADGEAKSGSENNEQDNPQIVAKSTKENIKEGSGAAESTEVADVEDGKKKLEELFEEVNGLGVISEDVEIRPSGEPVENSEKSA